MKPENIFDGQSEAEHRMFEAFLSQNSDLPDQLWASNEAYNDNHKFTNLNINSSSGNLSDDSTASKEAFPATMPSSWEDEAFSDTAPYGINLPEYMKTYNSSIVHTARGFAAQDQYLSQESDKSVQAITRLEYQLARLTLQYHALAESYNDSILLLRQAEADNERLRKENLQLQASNMELTMRESKHFLDDKTYNDIPFEAGYSVMQTPSSTFSYNDHLVNSTVESSTFLDASASCFNNSTSHSNGLMSILSCRADLEGMEMQQPRSRYMKIMKSITADVSANSPTSVLSGFDDLHSDFNNKLIDATSKSAANASNLDKTVVVNKPTPRGLPKSISIRSTGFLNMKMNGDNTPSREGVKRSPQLSKTVPSVISPHRPHRLRLTATADIVPVAVASPTGQDDDRAQDVEYDVYNQGMFKTELCNKWQDTGACPYGDRCQFAHGIEELRPVIRHPRYKTELCRMVAAGDRCPYGHRCHFRHTLTQEEKATAAATKQHEREKATAAATVS